MQFLGIDFVLGFLERLRCCRVFGDLTSGTAVFIIAVQIYIKAYAVIQKIRRYSNLSSVSGGYKTSVLTTGGLSDLVENCII